MKDLARRVGSLLLAWGILHGALTACSGDDTTPPVCAGPGIGGAGGSTASVTVSATGTGGAASSSSAATTAAATSSSGAGGSGACSCVPSIVLDVSAGDFSAMPVGALYPTWVAFVQLLGRTPESLLGTVAYGVPEGGGVDPLGDNAMVPYEQIPVLFRNNTVFVVSGAKGQANKEAPTYKSVRFIVPPAP